MLTKQAFVLFFILNIILISSIVTTPYAVASSDNTTSIYSLIIINRTPQVKAGETVVITVFLNGYGIPEKNKISIGWSSPSVLDHDNPGTFQIGDASPVGIDRIGIISRFNPLIFRDAPDKYGSYGFPSIMTEKSRDDNTAPIILKLNTAKNAPPGDYLVTFVFTYGDMQNIQQDYKDISFHILSWWEMNEQALQIIAVIIAMVALVGSLFYDALSYHKPHHNKDGSFTSHKKSHN